MIFLKSVLGKTVIDSHNNKLGVLVDLIINHQGLRLQDKEPAEEIKGIEGRMEEEPTVDFLVIKLDPAIRKQFKGKISSRNIKVKWCVSSINDVIKLNKPIKDINVLIIDSSDLLLKRTFLAKRVISLREKRVVKLVDIGLRTRHEKLVVSEAFYNSKHYINCFFQCTIPWLKMKRKSVSWNEILPLIENVRLRDSFKLDNLHNADLAEIIKQLNKKELRVFLKVLQARKAAEAISRLDSKSLRKCVRVMSEKTLLDFLNQLPPSKIAKVLRSFNHAKKGRIFLKLDIKKVKYVNMLLSFPKNEVGALMSLNPIIVNEEMSVKEIVEELRKQKPDERNPYYIYVVDNNKRIVGVLTVRSLLISEEDKKAREIMIRDVIKLRLNDKVKKAKALFKKYKFSAFPVVNQKGEIKGVLTIKDLI